jgi:hypothetical protein
VATVAGRSNIEFQMQNEEVGEAFVYITANGRIIAKKKYN